MSSSDNLGTVTNGKLPNITGTFNPDGYYANQNLSGCFYNTGRTNRAKGTGTDQTGYIFAIDAYRSSAVYTDGQTTVVPAGVNMRWVIKY